MQNIAAGYPLPLNPIQLLSQDFKVNLKQVLLSLGSIFPLGSKLVVSSQTRAQDLLNDLAIANCKRIFVAAKDPLALRNIALDFHVTMADQEQPETIAIPRQSRLPGLFTSNLPAASAQEAASTASPARGTAMLNSIFTKVRVPEFRFKWQFWAEKGQSSGPKTEGAEEYASRPKPLGDVIVSVKDFYQHFNNMTVESLKLRDSIHLFHLGVKPLWEDPRNMRGGAYYFKINKDIAAQFWHEICLLAVGDALQGAVETKRESFNDDICGISYSVRWNAVQVAVWNRDADNEAGREKLLQVILEKLSDELKPKDDKSYWYKAHREHKGFAAPE